VTDLATRSSGLTARQQWLAGSAVVAVGFGLFVLPALDKWREASRQLTVARTTLASKQKLVESKDVLVTRLDKAEAALAEAEAKLTTAENQAPLAQWTGAEARRAGCSVVQIQPLRSRVLERPEVQKQPRKNAGKKEARPALFIEWPVRLVAQGEYKQIAALLSRLQAGERHVRVTQLLLRTAGADGRRLQCEIEVAGYGLQAAPQGE
jgi:hypothetical protein